MSLSQRGIDCWLNAAILFFPNQSTALSLGFGYLTEQRLVCVVCELWCLVNGMDVIEILSGTEAQPEHLHQHKHM